MAEPRTRIYLLTNAPAGTKSFRSWESILPLLNQLFGVKPGEYISDIDIGESGIEVTFKKEE